jgi:hypothetical protein
MMNWRARAARDRAPESAAEDAQLPFAGYDRLDAGELITELSAHSQVELKAV